MVWQEKWVHPHAYGFRKKRGTTDAAALIALLIELHTVMRATLKGFWLDYVKCFDLIPQQVVLRVALEQGMHLGTHRALSGMYTKTDPLFQNNRMSLHLFRRNQWHSTRVSVECHINQPHDKHLEENRGCKVTSHPYILHTATAGVKPGEALDFILTALGYADDTYGVAVGQHTVQSLLECTHDWLQTTGKDVNPKKSVSFIIPDTDQTIRMRGVPFPKESEFRSPGAGVRTTDIVASCPLILKRIGKASALLDWIHGVQGNFEDKCHVVPAMVNATGLHVSEIVAISQKDARPFETQILRAICGAPRRAGRRKLFSASCVRDTNLPLPY